MSKQPACRICGTPLLSQIEQQAGLCTACLRKQREAERKQQPRPRPQSQSQTKSSEAAIVEESQDPITAQIGFRIKVSTAERLKRRVEAESTTVSEFVRRLVEEALEDEPREQP